VKDAGTRFAIKFVHGPIIGTLNTYPQVKSSIYRKLKAAALCGREILVAEGERYG
jgi:hypothetical protein